VARLTKEQARRIAQEECIRRGISWGEPVAVHWGLFAYTVWAHADRRGGNTIVRVRKKDAAILEAFITPR